MCQRLLRRLRSARPPALAQSVSRSLEVKAAAMQDAVLLLVGGVVGEDDKYKCTQQLLAFSLEFRRFYAMAPLPFGYDSGVACVRHGQDVFVSGLGEFRMNFCRYIASQNLWRVLKPMTIGRRGHAMVCKGRYVFVLGGMTDQEIDGPKRITAMVERYDIKKNTWSFAATLPESVWGHSAVVTGTKIVTFGGYQARDTPTTSVQTYDMKSGIARVTSQLPFPVALTQAVEHNGYFYILCPTGTLLKTRDCWRFTTLCTLPDFRRAMFGVALHRGRLLVAGGKFEQTAHDDLLAVDLASQAVATLPDRLPRPAYGLGLVATTLSRALMVDMAAGL